MVSPFDADESGASGWAPGQLVGDYTLLASIARGGMGEVWLAREQAANSTQGLVAIKRMDAAIDQDPDSFKMFLSEARLAARLSHPNVVRVIEMGEHANSPYLVMEYLEGEDLSSVRRAAEKQGRPLPDHLVARWVALAAAGLHHAHTAVGPNGKPAGIVHRDVSPQNLIATYDGGLRLVDFGVARVATQHTNSGLLKGKIAYMSPEQARGEPVDGRSDVFALGVVLFELVTRTRLFPGASDLEMLSKLTSWEPLPRAAERRPDVPPGLEHIVGRALEVDRAHRYQSAGELQTALERWLADEGQRASPEDLTAYLRELFEQRIDERRQLTATARTSALTPRAARRLLALTRAEGSRSRTRSRLAQVPDRTLERAVIGMAVVVALLAAAIGWRLTRNSEAPAAEVAPPGPPAVEVTARADLEVTSRPADAVLTVDGVEKGQGPLTLVGLPPGTHTIEARREGYAPATKTVTLALGQRSVIDLVLEPEPMAPPAPDAGQAPSEALSVGPAPEAAPVTEPVEPTKPKPAPGPVPAQRRGKLTLKTTPWTTVYLGKKKLGDTPLIEVALPAGRHKLRLVNAEEQVDRTVEFEIRANETTLQKLNL